MKSAFTMLKYRVFSYDANERILFMKLGSGMYKEIARDALDLQQDGLAFFLPLFCLLQDMF